MIQPNHNRTRYRIALVTNDGFLIRTLPIMADDTTEADADKERDKLQEESAWGSLVYHVQILDGDKLFPTPVTAENFETILTGNFARMLDRANGHSDELAEFIAYEMNRDNYYFYNHVLDTLAKKAHTDTEWCQYYDNFWLKILTQATELHRD